MRQHFEVRPIAPGFVAEMTGLGLDRRLAGTVADDIAAVWAEHPVVVFPGQPLDHVGLARFARHLGDFGHDPYIRPVPGHEHVIEVRREPGESTPIFGASWHSDWSFQATPPSATLLHAKTVPPIGGDTLFADCYRAYETLSPDIKETLHGLQAVHSAAPAYGPHGLFAKDDASRSMQIVVSADAENAQIHPVVRTHPVSGRRSLFVNHVYTVGIEGMDRRESRSLLKFLFDHMTRDDFTYRHQWRSDMLVLWDNRCVIHYAEGGYAGYPRVMHRTTVAGERPLAHTHTRSQR
jgi:taurine dioxygenase